MVSENHAVNPAIALTSPGLTSPTTGEKTVSHNGHSISTSLPPGFEEVNNLAIQEFRAMERPNGEVVVFTASHKPPDAPATEKTSKFGITIPFGLSGSKKEVTEVDIKSTKLDKAAKELYDKATEGLVLHQGNLSRVKDDGSIHDLGLSPAALLASIRSSVKVKDTATTQFTIMERAATTEKPTPQLFITEHSTNMILKSDPMFTRGGCGAIFNVFDLASKESIILKEKTDKGQDASMQSKLEAEHDNIQTVNPNGKVKTIVDPPILLFCLEGGDSRKVCLFQRRYENGDLEKFQRTMGEKGQPISMADKVKNILRLCDAASVLSKKLLHADIKAGNVFVDDKRNTYLADFDGALKLDSKSIRATAQEIASNNYSRSSDSVCNNDNLLLRGIASLVVAKGDELASKKAEKADKQEIKNLETELKSLEDKLVVMSDNIHSFEIAMMACATLLDISNQSELVNLCERFNEGNFGTLENDLRLALKDMPHADVENFVSIMKSALMPLEPRMKKHLETTGGEKFNASINIGVRPSPKDMSVSLVQISARATNIEQQKVSKHIRGTIGFKDSDDEAAEVKRKYTEARLSSPTIRQGI